MRRGWFMLLAGVLAALVGTGVHAVARGVEHTTVDWRYQVRGDRAPAPDVAIVAIDPDTGRAFGERLPPTRDQQAAVVRNLTAAGARVIAYDLVLKGVTEPDPDDAIVAALDARNTVLAVNAYDSQGTPEDLIAGIGDFADSDVVPGNINRLPVTDEGSWIRFTPAIGPLDSFAYAAAKAFSGRRMAFDERALIDFRGPAGTLRPLSFADVHDGNFDPASVRGKVVVIGVTAPEFHDQHDTPFGRMDGVELQANAIATALDGFPLRTVGNATTLLLAALMPLVALALGRRRSGAGSLELLGAGVASIALWAVAAQLAFNAGYVVAFVPGAAALATATALLWARASAEERRRLTELRRRFADGETELISRVVSSQPGDEVYDLKFVGGYQLQLPIGSGGMGVVWRAKEPDLEREVAVKVIRERHALNPGYRARFLREARSAAMVEHPYVVPIYHVGGDGGSMYIVMRLIDGYTLRDRLRERGRMELGEAAALLHRIAGALDKIGRAGIVHRDIKPENILLAHEDPGHPYLTDFGIAAPAASGPVAGGQAGTFAYMAPEQIANRDLSHATDIYALGAVLFHCVTGSTPFPFVDQDDVLVAHATKARPKASDVNPTLPVALDGLIEQAMAIDPAERFRAATSFTQAVLDIVPDEPTADDADDDPDPAPRPTQPV
ncbi:CHASE2 domain-containing serine/threonine-protein kinase [Solirubrobacter soli]|uniref:CHASE2 domain-containing serine/threonine-protein kinase n=1 Tax=Solirubrobacter soli TaxID=363832 RepID=UPI00069CE787|nr:serine/threonine-protein kinase [Solirubrobacter soli]